MLMCCTIASWHVRKLRKLQLLATKSFKKALHWVILRWNFDVEHVDMILRYNVQGFIVRAAHFGARMLKVRPTGEGGTPKRLKIWLFQGANVDEMD